MWVIFEYYLSHIGVKLCTMKHRGEIIKKAVYESGMPISQLAFRLNRSRRWVYLMFENQNVSIDLVLAIGKIINFDFGSEIKEIRNNVLQEGATPYPDTDESVEYWKNKYIQLLEEYTALLKNTGNQSK